LKKKKRIEAGRKDILTALKKKTDRRVVGKELLPEKTSLYSTGS